MESIDVFAPLASLQWVDRNTMYRSSASVNSMASMYLPSAPKTSSLVGALSKSVTSKSLI